MDVSTGPHAAEPSPSRQKFFFEGRNNPIGDAAAEAGPPLTPLGQLHPQHASAEPIRVSQKETGPVEIVSSGQNGKTFNLITAAIQQAASTQRPARVAPPRAAAPPTAQPLAPRQNPIITNAMAAVEENGPWLCEIPSVPVYSPTAEEWKDPLAYIRSIQPEAGKYGACVVKAPITPAVPAALLLKDLRFTTRLQKVKHEPWGKTWEDGIKFWDSGRKCTLAEYAKFADDFARRKLGLAAELPTATVESLYWQEKETSRAGRDCTVEYGNDVEGSAFHPHDPLGQTNWNLNSFSNLPGSALRWCLSPAPGVTTPMLYIGMLYATFAWHVEDHFMYSINYSHAGASKVWYCVPASAADGLETTAAETIYREPCETMKKEQGASIQACNEAVAEALAGKTTMMSPRYLLDRGIPVYRAVQEAGSYIITFPRSYHSGFSTGFNLGEAVNFVLSDWWPFGEHARRLYKLFNRPQILSHEQVLCDDAAALDTKLEETTSINGGITQQKLSKEDKPVAVAFVAMMQRVHRLRQNFQEQRILQLGTCSPNTEIHAPEMRDSIPCTRCSHLSYLVSAVVGAEKAQNQWEHICLDCAAGAGADDTVAVATAGAQENASGGSDACSNMMLYVKPLWSTMENRAKKFAALLAREQAPAQDGNFDVARKGGAEAVAMHHHQMLSLDGCSARVKEDPETLSTYIWTDLKEPVLFAPSWVGQGGGQSEDSIIAGDGVGSGGGGSSRDESLQENPSHLEASAVPLLNINLRKRSREVQARNSLMRKGEEEEEEEDDDRSALLHSPSFPTSPSALKKTHGYSKYRASESPCPTLEATLYCEDTITVPGSKKLILPRHIYKLQGSGELVIRGSDIIKTATPYHTGNKSVSRQLARRLLDATHNDVTAPDRYILYIKSKTGQRSPAIGKSGAEVLLKSEKMKEREDYGAFCAAFKGIWDTSIVEHGEEKQIAVGVAPTSLEKPTRPRRGSTDVEDAVDAVDDVDYPPKRLKRVGKQSDEKDSLLFSKQPQSQVFLSQNSGQQQQQSSPSAAAAKRQRPAPSNTKNQSSLAQASPQQQYQILNNAKFKQQAMQSILEEIEKSTSGYIANKGVALKEARGSTANLKTYNLPVSSSSPSSTSKAVVVVAAYHLIFKVTEASNHVATTLSRWVRAVGGAPGVTADHIVCLAPLLYNCANWRKSTSTFVLTLEQCAIFYHFGMDRMWASIKTEATASDRKSRMLRIMASIWGRKAVDDTFKVLIGGDFNFTLPLENPTLKKTLFGIDDSGDGDGGGASSIVAANIAVNKTTQDAKEISELPNERQPPLSEPKIEPAGAASGGTDEATSSGGGDKIDKKKFVPFPSLFQSDTSLPLTSQPPISTLNVAFSVAADPEEVDVEIEAENNRRGGSGGDGGGDEGVEKEEVEKSESMDNTANLTPTPIEEKHEEEEEMEGDMMEEGPPASEALHYQHNNGENNNNDDDGADGVFTDQGAETAAVKAVEIQEAALDVNALPPLDADVLDLMEAEVFGPAGGGGGDCGGGADDGATIVVAGAKHFIPQSLLQSVLPIASDVQYNAYQALSPLYLHHQHQHHQQLQLLQKLHQQRLTAAVQDAPVMSLQNPQVILSGNNWDGVRSASGDTSLPLDHQLSIVPLFVAPQGAQPGGGGGGGSDGGMALNNYPGWNNMGEVRRW